MPPNGRSGVVQVGWLTNTMPASMRLATRLPRAISLVKTDPPNPKSESLASATASSSLLTRNRSATGPKSSSRYAGLPGLMFARIVGSAAYNDKLAVSRANTVRDFLVKYGAGGAQITASGDGKRNPGNSNATPEGRLMNRR